MPYICNTHMVAVQGRTAEPVAERSEERELIKKPCHVKVGNVPLSAVESLRAADDHLPRSPRVLEGTAESPWLVILQSAGPSRLVRTLTPQASSSVRLLPVQKEGCNEVTCPQEWYHIGLLDAPWGPAISSLMRRRSFPRAVTRARWLKSQRKGASPLFLHTL